MRKWTIRKWPLTVVRHTMCINTERASLISWNQFILTHIVHFVSILPSLGFHCCYWSQQRSILKISVFFTIHLISLRMKQSKGKQTSKHCFSTLQFSTHQAGLSVLFDRFGVIHVHVIRCSLRPQETVVSVSVALCLCCSLSSSICLCLCLPISFSACLCLSLSPSPRSPLLSPSLPPSLPPSVPPSLPRSLPPCPYMSSLQERFWLSIVHVYTSSLRSTM